MIIDMPQLKGCISGHEVYIYGIDPAHTAHYDIVISGAGPAGTSCALALAGSGLRVALADKATFPRDKICGDAIPGRAVKVLTQLGAPYTAAFRELGPKLLTRHTSLYYKGRNIHFSWTGEAYTCARMDFDQFLYTQAAGLKDLTLLPGTEIRSAESSASGIRLGLRDGSNITCRLLVAADGANSTIARQLAGHRIDRSNHVGSVRAYYSNVTGLDEQTTEVYFLKEMLPSYLWIFPLPGGRANVGFGMLSSEISRRKLDLKKLFHQFVTTMPQVALRLQNAVPDGPLEGYGLPLGGKTQPISGESYMLAGDAAPVIDPMSGDGIGNAMLTGRLAALQAIRCFEKGNFSASFLTEYDRAVSNAIGGELKLHLRTRRVLARAPFLLNTIFAAASNPLARRWIQKAL